MRCQGRKEEGVGWGERVGRDSKDNYNQPSPSLRGFPCLFPWQPPSPTPV